MKRTPLIRRTPLRRTGSTMRHVAKGKVTVVRAANERRRNFRAEVGRCMMPLCRETRFHYIFCHEVANGQNRGLSLLEPSLWLVLCDPCHKKIHAENMPEAAQIGLRKLWFPADDSRAAYLRVTGYAETHISEETILEWTKHFAKEARGW